MVDFEGRRAVIPDRIMKDIHDMVLDSYIFYYPETSPIFEDEFFVGKRSSKHYRGYCTFCNQWVDLEEKPKHKSHGFCPFCYAETTFYSGYYGRKNIKDYKFVRAFDIKEDCVALYEISVNRCDYSGYEWDHQPMIEDIYAVKVHVLTADSWTAYKAGYDGIMHISGVRSFCGRNTLFGNGFMGYGYYRTPKFIPADLSHTVIGHKIDCIGEDFEDLNWWDRLEQFLEFPFLEQMHKAGYERFCTYPYRSRIINKRADSWNNLIRIGDKKLKARVMQYLRADRTVSAADIEDVTELMRSRADFLPLYAVGQSMHRIKRIFDKLPMWSSKKIYNYAKNHDQSIWSDYLSMAIQAGTDMSIKSNAFPKELEEEHDKLSLRIKLAGREKERVGVAERYELLCGRGLDGYRHSGLIVFAPSKAEDIIIEGQRMHNCVGSYLERHAQGETNIFFIRKENAPENSYFTLELKLPEKKGETTVIRQCYGYGNKISYTSDKAQDVSEFLRKFTAHINWCFKHKKQAKKYHGKDVNKWTKSQKQKAAV